MNDELKFYYALFLRRLPVMATIFALCTVLSIALALTLPPRYKADATLLVEGSKIPKVLAISTVQTHATEQLQIIEQELMTRNNLIDVANRINVFEGSEGMNPDTVLRQMRDQTYIRLQPGGLEGATLMFIEFTANRPDIAADVVNEFVTLVLNADAKRRQDESGETLDFFEVQVERFSAELSMRSGEIVVFKEANKDALPEGLEYRMDRQSTLQERLNLVARDRASLVDQRDRLIALGTANGSATIPLSPQQQQLVALEAELNSALSVYSENNPKVRMLRARLDQLLKKMPSSESAEPSISGTLGSVLELQLAEIDSRVAFIDLEIERTEGELFVLRTAIERTPEVAIALDELEREYESTQSLLNQAANAHAAARSGVDIEVAAKGERIRPLEFAVQPNSPNSPNRKLVAGGGVFAGSALAALFFVLTELLNRTIRRPSDLARGLGVTPLATIPYIEEDSAKRRHRALKMILVVGMLIAIPTALWVVHTSYLPLDLLIEKAAIGIGL